MLPPQVITGFQYKKTQPGQWFVGSKKARARFGATVLMPGGHGWKKFVPQFERQNINGVESYACTVYASLKAWITLAKYYGYDFPPDCAERFNAILARIVPPGANPHDVGESIRTWGAIPDKLLPFDETIRSLKDFYSPDPMDEQLIAQAKKVVQKYVLGHEYVFNDHPLAPPTKDKPAKLMAALERGPVCASVHGWKEKDGLYYKDKYDPDNHWTFIIDFKEKEYWLAHDQYKPFLKKIAWDTNFQTAEVYFMKPNPSGVAPNDITYFEKMLRRMMELLARIAT